MQGFIVTYLESEFQVLLYFLFQFRIRYMLTALDMESDFFHID